MATSSSHWLFRVERVLLTFWIGGLWVCGYLVVPTLFSILDDRHTAGLLAGQIFKIMNYVGLGVGSLLLISLFLSSTTQKRHVWHQYWREIMLAVMLILITIAAFWVQPMMQELKAQGISEGSIQATQFGQLHGISSIMFLLNSLLGLCLVAVGLRSDSTNNSVEQQTLED